MKHIITISLAIMIAFAASAQKNVTKFLGIPVDGTKTSMIQKLKEKGFTYDAKNDMLNGEFNGRDVDLHVVTNNNKVYRIMAVDSRGSSEGDIKIRFNTLCRQFEKNSKYIKLNYWEDYTIGDDVDLSYEIGVNEKRFQAAYYQYAEADKDTSGMAAWLMEKIEEEYGLEKYRHLDEEEAQLANMKLGIEYVAEKVAHKLVWFMIDRKRGLYYIYMYYDNGLNQANGEDL